MEASPKTSILRTTARFRCGSADDRAPPGRGNESRVDHVLSRDRPLGSAYRRPRTPAASGYVGRRQEPRSAREQPRQVPRRHRLLILIGLREVDVAPNLHATRTVQSAAAHPDWMSSIIDSISRSLSRAPDKRRVVIKS